MDISSSDVVAENQRITGDQEVINELEAMMANHNEEEQGAQVVDIQVVHAMFKKMQSSFQSQLNDMQKKVDKLTEKETTSEQPTVSDIAAQVDRLTIKMKATSCAIQNAWEDRCVLEERLAKTELNLHRKMITISGLELNGKKYQKIQQLENFFDTELGIQPYIEDFYEIGSKQPTVKVVIFQSLRDKALVMRTKKYLKGLQNKYKQSLYINDFVPQEELEKRKKAKVMFRANEEKEDHDKEDMLIENGKLYISKELFVNPLQPPNPQDIIDFSTQRLAEIMQMEITPGPEIKQEGNTFIAYSLCTNSLQDIQDGYMKMKLKHPKARHIICAYLINDEELQPHANRGSCDDGEHGAGEKLLEYLVQQNMECRAIWVVRYYSGKKIGPDRFTCMLTALKECLEMYSLNTHLGRAQEIPSEDDEYDSATASQESLNTAEAEQKTRVPNQTPRGRGRGRGSYSNAAKKQPGLSRSDKPNFKRRLNTYPDTVPHQKSQPRQQTFNPDGSFSVKKSD